MLAAITGLAALLHTNPLLFSLIKYMGAAYMLIIVWQTVEINSCYPPIAKGQSYPTAL